MAVEYRAHVRRPGFVTAAAVVMMIQGGLAVLYAIAIAAVVLFLSALFGWGAVSAVGWGWWLLGGLLGAGALLVFLGIHLVRLRWWAWAAALAAEALLIVADGGSLVYALVLAGRAPTGVTAGEASGASVPILVCAVVIILLLVAPSRSAFRAAAEARAGLALGTPPAVDGGPGLHQPETDDISQFMPPPPAGSDPGR